MFSLRKFKQMFAHLILFDQNFCLIRWKLSCVWGSNLFLITFCNRDTQGSHPYQSLSYTSGDTAADSPAHVSRAGLPAKDSPRKESLLSNLTGSFRSLHNLLEGMPQRNEPSAATAAKSSSLTRTGTRGSNENCAQMTFLPANDHIGVSTLF